MSEEQKKIEPCPFCGSKAYLHYGKMFRVGSQSWHVAWEEEHFPAVITCMNNKCGISMSCAVERIEENMPVADLYKKAAQLVVEKWNKRAEALTADQRAKLIRLCEAVKNLEANSNSDDGFYNCPFCGMRTEWSMEIFGGLDEIEHTGDCAYFLAKQLLEEFKG